MSNNDNELSILASIALDMKKSEKNIKNQTKQLEKKDLSILTQAALDVKKTENLVNKQIKNIKAEGLLVDVKINDKQAKTAIQNVSKQFELLERQNISNSNAKLRASGNLGNFNNYITKIKPNALKEYTDDIKGIQNAFKTVNSQADLTKANAQVTDFKGRIKEANLEGKSFGQTFGDNFKKFANWYLIGNIMVNSIKLVKSMVDNVIQLDTAMTELRKVTDETDKTYSNFLNNAGSKAKELGATITDVVSATADFARLGYNIGDASELAEAAIIYKNVGDGINNISTASESLISTMKAFGIESSKSMTIVDKFNEVGNNFAISSKGVGDGLKRSAASLASAGNSLDESIALITAANEIIQDPDIVGTAMKTTSMRLRGTKEAMQELEEETDGAINSVSSLRAELKSLTNNQVDIMIDDSTFKSSYKVLLEMSKVMDSMTDVNKARAIELMFGKRQGEVGMALLSNMKQAEKVVETSANSAGSALEENEKHLQSIKGKVEVLSATFQDLSKNVIDSSAIKTVVDLGTGLLKIVDTTHLLQIALTSLGIVGVVKLLTLMSTTLTATAIKTKLLNSELVISKAVMLGLKNAELETYTITQLLGLGFTGLTAKIAASTKAMVAFLTTNPVGWAILAGSAIFAAVKIFEFFNVTIEEQKEKVKEASEEYKVAKQNLDDINNELKTTCDRIDELNKKDKLTFAEQGELKKLQDITKELLIQQDILQKEANEKARNEFKEKKKLYEKQTKHTSYEINQENLDRDYDTYINYNASSFVSSAPRDTDINAQLVEYKRAKEELDKSATLSDEYLKQVAEQNFKNVEKQLQNSIKNLNDYKLAISSLSDKDKISLLGKDWEQQVERLDKDIEFIYNKIDPAKIKEINFNEIINKSDFKEIKAELESLSSQGKLTAETLNDPKYSDLVSQLNKVGISAEQATTELNSLGKSNVSEDINNSVSVLSKDLSAITDKFKLLSDVIKEFSDNNSLSASSLDAIVDKYPNMIDYVNQYIVGLITEQDLIEQLSQQYAIDEENYYKSTVNKMQYSDTFYNKILENNTEFVNEFAKQYNIDLTNFKSLAEAKKAIEDTLLDSMTQNWRKYFEGTAEASETALQQIRMHDPEKYLKMQHSIADYHEAIKKLENISFKPVKANFDKVKNSIDKTKASTKDLKSEVNSANSAVQKLLSLFISMRRQDYQNQIKNFENIKKELNSQLDTLREIYEEKRKAIEEETNGYEKAISLQLKLLKLKKEEHDFEKDLKNKQKSVNDIQSEIDKLAFDDSESAKRRRLELESEFAKEKESLDEHIYDENIRREEQALNDELERFRDVQNNKLNLIEQENKQKEKNHKQELDRLDTEIQRIQDYISLESNLRNEAMNMMNEKNNDYYKRLIEWNKIYGDGIDQNIRNAWDNAYTVLGKFNGGQIDTLGTLNKLASQMDKFDGNIKNAASSANNLATNLNKAAKQQENLNKQQSDYLNQQAKFGIGAVNAGINVAQKYGNIPRYSNGGIVSHTGLAIVDGSHNQPELMLNGKQAVNLVNAMARSNISMSNSKMQNLSKFNKLPSGGNTLNVDKLIEINVSGSVDESVLPKLQRTMENAADKVFEKINFGNKISGMAHNI